MSTLNNSLNVVACGLGNTLGSGTYGCLARIKKAQSFWLTTAGYEFDGDTDFTNTYVQQLVAEGKIIALNGVAEVEDQSTQNSYEDIGDGVKVLDVEGKYEFKIKFIKGLWNNRILDSLSGNGSFDLLAIDTQGRLIGTTSATGNLKGFTLGVHQAELMEGFLSANTARESFVVQLTDTSEIATYALKESDENFNAKSAASLNQVKLTFTAAPSDTDTTVSIKAVRQQDGAAFTGVDYSKFLFTVNGTTVNPTAGDDSATTGTFVLTGITALATNDVVTARLYDNTNSRAGIYVDSIGYKSNILTATVVA